MPLYEYQCESCSHRFEVIQKFSDAPLDTCPKCGGVVRKLLSSPAFHFKGSGWYITDYARKGGEGAGGEKSTSSAPSSSGGETKSESKSDTKTDATPAPSTDSKPSSGDSGH